MDSYPFGHTSPVWINEIGSTDPIAKAQAQVELLGALNQLEAHAQQTYGDEDISKLMGRLKSAKAVLAN
ncbi:MAG: hypothetical protein P8N61_08100, partial [Porticoccaceae bacterium]|jgi:TolB protein|nr:hypothetical protein [Porticoccaceae bacterium]